MTFLSELRGRPVFDADGQRNRLHCIEQGGPALGELAFDSVGRFGVGLIDVDHESLHVGFDENKFRLLTFHARQNAGEPFVAARGGAPI